MLLLAVTKYFRNKISQACTVEFALGKRIQIEKLAGCLWRYQVFCSLQEGLFGFHLPTHILNTFTEVQ